jgi:cobalamin synthase
VVVLSQPISWLVFLLGIATVRALARVCLLAAMHSPHSPAKKLRRLIQRYTRSIVIVFALYTAAAAWFVNTAFIHSGTTYRVLPLSSSVPVFPLISVSAPMWSRHGLADFAGCAGV